MSKEIINKPRVKGHGTFVLRDGWINKALSELAKDGNERVFTASDATDIFGIGSNMVTALRYWVQCFGFIDETKISKGCFLSELGMLVYENDRYLEDLFTIWVMHSNLVKNYDKASLFHDYFNDEKIHTIGKEQLTTVFVRKWKEFDIPEKSIESDVTVLFNTYCKSKINDDPEDKIVSPLTELGLISVNNDVYTKIQPDLRTLPDEIILYELSNIFDYEYANKEKTDEKRSISIERVASGLYSLGSIYNLSKVATNQVLNRLQNLNYIKVDRTAGLDVIYDEGIPKPLDVIKEYYAQR